MFAIRFVRLKAHSAVFSSSARTDRVWRMCAESEEEREKWLAALNAVIDADAARHDAAAASRVMIMFFVLIFDLIRFMYHLF